MRWGARFAPKLVPALGASAVLVFVIAWFQTGNLPGDAFTCLAAGQRLNVGHELYIWLASQRRWGAGGCCKRPACSGSRPISCLPVLQVSWPTSRS